MEILIYNLSLHECKGGIMARRKQQKVYGIKIDSGLKELRKRNYLKYLKEVQERVLTKYRYENCLKKQVISKN